MPKSDRLSFRDSSALRQGTDRSGFVRSAALSAAGIPAGLPGATPDVVTCGTFGRDEVS